MDNKSCRYNDISIHFEANGINDNFQSAYKSGHTCETALIRVYNDIVTTIDKGNGSGLVLLDLSAAFDTIDHENLFHHLEKYVLSLLNLYLHILWILDFKYILLLLLLSTTVIEYSLDTLRITPIVITYIITIVNYTNVHVYRHKKTYIDESSVTHIDESFMTEIDESYTMHIKQ